MDSSHCERTLLRPVAECSSYPVTVWQPSVTRCKFGNWCLACTVLSLVCEVSVFSPIVVLLNCMLRSGGVPQVTFASSLARYRMYLLHLVGNADPLCWTSSGKLQGTVQFPGVKVLCNSCLLLSKLLLLHRSLLNWPLQKCSAEIRIV